MANLDILAIFCNKFFGTYAKQLTAWSSRGENTIWVELKNHQRLRFTYIDENEWYLSPVVDRSRSVVLEAR